MAGSSSDVARVARRSLWAGALAGIVAPIASIVLVAGALTVDGAFVLRAGAGRAVATLLYSAHHVAISVRSGTGSYSVDFLALAGGSFAIPTVVYYLIPIVVLLAAGYVTARVTLVESRVPAGAVAGATVTVTYLPIAVIGAIFLVRTAGGESVGPDLASSALMAGLAYPILFGGIGGAIATATD